MEKKQKFLTVAPFECAWHDNLRFREAGRGCVAFDAFAHNDVTVVFREKTGSQHYHYKRDNSPHYTVIIGSHRNKRLNIEVDGKTVVDVAGVDLYCSSAFQSYWISIYDGLISIGKGRYPFQNLVFQWLDSNPNCSVQYVGLSSWDRHVGYRNINVLPLKQNHISLWKHVDCGEYSAASDEELEEEIGDYENWGLDKFLVSWELSDVFFIVGQEERAVPAHKVILAASGNFSLSPTGEDIIHIQDVCYTALYALLEYIYTGNTEVPESLLSSLKSLSLRFEVSTLAKQCDEMMERFKLNKKLFDSGKSVEISYPSSRLSGPAVFLNKIPIDIKRLSSFLLTSEYSDVDIYVEGHGQVAQSHRIILGLWSAPFTKMFTNGMTESASSKICLRDVYFDAFRVMLQFMYSGEINDVEAMDTDVLLLQLLLLADQFGVSLLHQECCKRLLEHLSEDSVCQILLVISSIASCKIIEETCERTFSMHFDYCTTASIDFVMLDEATFGNILQHPDLTVTSEERVLNAILLWCCEAEELFGWERVDEMMLNLSPYLVFGERLGLLEEFLDFVRFPLLPYPILQKLDRSNLSMCIPRFGELVKEAISFLEFGASGHEKDLKKFQHRRSSFKELQYICNGDSNGVLYFAGTSYGEHQWVNPVLSKKVTITASSPLSRFTDPKVLVSRSYQVNRFTQSLVNYFFDGVSCETVFHVNICKTGQDPDLNAIKDLGCGFGSGSRLVSRVSFKTFFGWGVLCEAISEVEIRKTVPGTSFAGPRMEDGRNTAWWMVDLGHGHQLMCNHYTLRQDGSRAFIRNWCFQGSMDGSNWTNLRVHENDETICKPGQFASWPVVGPNALLPSRFFRAVLTAPTTDAANPWILCICFLELYGYFR